MHLSNAAERESTARRGVMQEQFEPWELGSGTWLRDRTSEQWRLVATRAGAVVDPGVPAQDVARLSDARCDPASGAWFPPDFKYSLHTGVPLHTTTRQMKSSWVPPFGEAGLSGTERVARGLKRTPVSLALAHARERSASGQPDCTLPPLPPGQYRFVVDRFDAACPTLIALEPDEGKLLVLLPESNQWMPLERTEGTSWAHRLGNPRAWRMELVHAHGHATAYCPSARGLAAITPSVFGLRHAVEYAGEGPALGGPVAWRGEIWMPVVGTGQMVHLVGKPEGTAGHMHIVLPTDVPVPLHGFEAPVFNDLHVTWPCDDGQMVLRLDADGAKQVDWITWPEHVMPIFEIGCPYVQHDGTFWQLCRRNDDGRYHYVQLAEASPQPAPVDALRPCTGSVCYRGTSRIDGGPWRGAQAGAPASAEIVVPLLESAHDGAVVGLRMDAPHGVLSFVHDGMEPSRAILQVEMQGKRAVSFGTIEVNRPWLALLFVYDAHLWLHHPDLEQALGWKLEQ
jgi:hypothetical protein